MSTPRDDAHVGDDDPTGVRDLLSSLPDPGPMPEDLVARIAERLEVEQDLRSGSRSGHGPVADVVPLTPRPRRPAQLLPWLAGAAAVALGTTVAVSTLVGGEGDSGLAARYPASISADSGGAGDDDGDAGAAGEQGADAGEQDDSARDGVAADSGTDVADREAAAMADEDAAASGLAVLATGDLPALSTHGLDQQLQEWWRATDAATSPLAGSSVTDTGSADPATLPGGGTPSACVQTLLPAAAPPDAFVVAPAELDGHAAVLVVRAEPEPVTAWLVGAGCGTDPDVAVLQGPLTLP